MILILTYMLLMAVGTIFFIINWQKHGPDRRARKAAYRHLIQKMADDPYYPFEGD